MIQALLSLLLAAHLLCVNVAAGGPVVAAWLDWRRHRGDEAAASAATYLARWSIATLLAGAFIGLLMGWLRWDSAYRALWTGPLSYKMHWAILEVVFSLVLLGVWSAWLPKKAGGSLPTTLARGLVAILASTNLLYHFPVLFSVAARLYDASQTEGARLGGAQFRALMSEGETPALAVHVALASVAVAGVMLLGLALRLRRAGQEQRAARIAVWGGRWALVASLVQLPVGLWLLASISPTAQSQIMGVDALATLLFIAGLLSAFWLLADLVKISMGESSRPLLIRSMALMLLTVSLMAAMQQQARPARGAAREQGTSSLQPRSP